MRKKASYLKCKYNQAEVESNERYKIPTLEFNLTADKGQKEGSLMKSTPAGRIGERRKAEIDPTKAVSYMSLAVS